MWIWIWLIAAVGVMGWELPLQQVSHPECKWVHWQELSDDCKIELDLPREQSMTELLISVLWWASYDDSHNQWSWWHWWVDFVTTVGTPVVAMGDGQVITAKYGAWFWNRITIRHDLEWESIYSNYSHLSVMNVRPGQRVEQWVKIWEVWRTGFTMGAFWYHLDFQITTEQSPSHPYGYHDCEKWTYMEAVQQWLCRDKLELYTIDPLEFFANYAWSDLRPIWRNSPIETQRNEEETLTAQVGDEQVAEVVTVAEQNQISSINSINDEVVPSPSIEKIVTEVPVLENTVVIRKTVPNSVEQEVLKEHAAALVNKKNQWTLSLTPGFDVTREVLWDANTKVWNIIPVQFTITQDNEPVSGKLSNRIRIQWDENVTLLPWSFGRIYKWKKTVFVRIQAEWTHRLDVKSGETQLWQIVLSIE